VVEDPNKLEKAIQAAALFKDLCPAISDNLLSTFRRAHHHYTEHGLNSRPSSTTIVSEPDPGPNLQERTPASPRDLGGRPRPLDLVTLCASFQASPLAPLDTGSSW